MLNARTLMVLGAGASFDFGMPLGEGLSMTIARKVDIRFDFPNKQVSGDHDLMHALRAIAQREQCDVNEYRRAGCSIAEGIGHSRSIDSYLATHEDNAYVKTCGKLAIVHSILEAERGSDLWVDQSRSDTRFQKYDKVMSSWLSDFMFLLTNGIVRTKNLEQVFDNLAIINFNYDRCLEQFFWYALRALFQINESEAARLVRTKLKILRPYGKVGELPMGERGIPFGMKVNPAQLEAIAGGIRTFNEQVQDQSLIDALHAEVAACDRVIFLGFHFHKQNTDLLTPKSLSISPPRPIYGTATGRSGPDVAVLQRRVAQMWHSQAGPIELGTAWDCKQIFRTYVTTWGA